MTKLEILVNKIKNFDNLAVAFSGGVDSSFLLKTASLALGKNTIAITAITPYMSSREIEESIEFTKTHNIRHEILELEILDELCENPEKRCYICKKNLFEKIIAYSKNLGFSQIADGTNHDDLNEYRPGLKAKEELGVISPLINLTKDEIRKFSHELNLITANKPSYSCLLTRFPYGYKFCLDDLRAIESIENLLIKNGYKEIRARFDGKTIKLQMTYIDMIKFLQDNKFKFIIKKINTFGNFEINLDLKGLKEEILK